jgi:aerobic-type carbon monoxide dehydrogenase small subunit (CoxS/CutS family)
MDANFQFNVNGAARKVTADADRTLLDVLREDLGLTGTKYGCGEGQCGACSVLVNDKRVFSCRTSVASVAGKSVTTIEGLAQGDRLHPVQEAFLAESAFQCGYCTPGMVIAAVALLKDHPRPSDADLVAGMNRNICRCCSYASYARAVRRAAGGAGEAQADGGKSAEGGR